MLGSGDHEANTAVESLIDWWEMAGVTSIVSETPVNWLQPVPPPTAPRIDTALVLLPPVLPASLETFHEWLATDMALPELAWPQLTGQAKRVLPVGSPAPSLMVICDMPDIADMEGGALLSGDVGRLFDAMMCAIGQKREHLYITSLALMRPTGGIIGESDGVQLANRMRHHISLVGPRRVLILGDKTSRALLPTVDEENVFSLRPLNHEGGTVDAIATSHPRFLLKQPSAKRGCWRQLQLLIEAQPA
ncbi:hypothetical protein SPH9361_03847 [Sphingobium sp. CECT 9361]|nr:hypothetical protein SPH9361_03847 [Sphingobium sp. CECT 9361]